MEKTNNELETIINIVTQMKKDLTSLQSRLKTLSKTSLKTKKNNTVSGFVTPVNVKSELADFLKMGKEDKVSRSFVNKKISEYIKENDLQLQNDRQWFMIDDKLSKIFSCAKGESMHYFKMQSFLKHNYIKT